MSQVQGLYFVPGTTRAESRALADYRYAEWLLPCENIHAYLRWRYLRWTTSSAWATLARA